MNVSPLQTAALTFQDALTVLIGRGDLSAEQMTSVMHEMLLGAWDDLAVATLLIALRMKGETATEIAAAATVLRKHMVRLPTGRSDLLDTCGTGGDGIGTFNISTATALVVAGAGVAIVKHGNRAVSSRSGSIDVLWALGVHTQESPAWVRRCLDEAGLAICFAPYFHPLLSKVASVRRRLGVRTLFNCLGPLANPAGAAYQLIGVGRADLLDPLAAALARLGTQHAFLVSGLDGMDEVSLSASTQVREVRGSTVSSMEWTPRDFGLEPCSLGELVVSGAAESAAVIRSILEGKESPAARVVIANASAALMAAERVSSLVEGVKQARDAIAGGRARHVLEHLIKCSQDGSLS